MKKHSKKIIAAVVAASLAILCVPGVFALFSSGEGTTNKFKTATADAKIVEKFDPPKELKEGDNVYRKDVKVQNTGNIPVYVRLGINFSDKTAEDATELYNEPIAGLLTKDAEPIKSAQDTDEEAWVFVPSSKDDTLGGYWYYTTPIDPGKSTKSLFNTVKTTFTASDLEEYDINVTMDCVQASDITPNEYTASGTKSVHNVNYKTPDDDYVADGKSDGWRHQWREYLLYTAGSTDQLGFGQKLPTKRDQAIMQGVYLTVPSDAVTFSRGTKEQYEAAQSAGLNIDTPTVEKDSVPVYTWMDSDKNFHWYTTAKKLQIESSFDLYRKTALTSVDFAGLDTSQVTDMSGFLYGCSLLVNIDGLGGLNTSHVTDMSNAFYKCSALKDIPGIENWDTSRVINMRQMFSNDKSLQKLDLSSFDTSNVTDMSDMFYSSENLVKINGVKNFNTAKVTDMSRMFGGCTKLSQLDLSSFVTSNVTNMASMFNGDKALGIVDVSSFDTSKVTDMSWMFYGSSYTKDGSGFTEIRGLDKFDTANVTDMSHMFQSNASLKALDLSHFKTSKVTNMDSMFSSDQTLSSLNLSNFDTSNVINMDSMFSLCQNLKDLNVSSFDTSKVINMSYMFYECDALSSIDISSFDTSKVTNMSYMFERSFGNTTLKNIYVSDKWNTDNVTSSNRMFNYCTSLPHFDSSKVDKTNANTSATGYLTLKQ